MSTDPSPIIGMLPVVGGAGAALALVFGAEQVGVSKLQAAVTLAGAGAVTAASAKGWARELAIGAAAAGTCVAVMEAVTLFRVARAFNAAAQAIEPATPTPPPADAITHAELHAALTKLSEQQAQANEELRANLKQIVAVAAAEALAAAPPRSVPSTPHSTPTPTTPPDTMPLDPVVMAKIQSVKARLTPDEVRRLNEIVAQLSGEQRAYLEHEIFRRPLDESVEYLRTQVIVGSDNRRARA